jgi:hypothetical protein
VNVIVCPSADIKITTNCICGSHALGEGTVLKDGLTQLKEGVGGSEWGTRRSIMPMENVQILDPKHINNENCINVVSYLVQ